MNGLDKLSSEALTELLLATTPHRVDERYFVKPRLHPAIELQKFYDRASLEDRARLKSALLDATAEWRASAHGFANLHFLSQSAAALRVRATAAHFERILQRNGLLHHSPGIAPEVAADLVATLAGFAPGEEIGALLERLFFAPGLRAELAGVLFQGLCRTKRGDLPKFLARYLSLIEGTDIQHFSNPIFLRLFIESLTPSALADAWSDLEKGLREFLLENLGRLRRTESPNLYFAFEEQGATLHVKVAGREDRFELRSSSVGHRFEDLHTAYGFLTTRQRAH